MEIKLETSENIENLLNEYTQNKEVFSSSKENGFFELITREKQWRLITREDEEIYKKLKERPAVKKIFERSRYFREANLIIDAILKIDEKLAQGLTYNDIFTSIIYRDCPDPNHALLNHVEERFNVKVRDAKQLQDLTGIDIAYMSDIENSYCMALEDRYSIAITEILHNNGKYQDLLALNPSDFGLPEQWDGLAKGMNKEKIILKAIFFHFHLGEEIFRTPLREVAKLIDAPYSEILKASRYYDHE